MTLGELIEALERETIRCPRKTLNYGFGKAFSYRGDYYDVAFEPAVFVNLLDMLIEAKAAVGKTFEGYKGGEFTMSLNTDVHIAEQSNSGHPLTRSLLAFLLDSDMSGAEIR